MDLVRDVLDKQLKDGDQRPRGKIDGIVIEIADGQQPIVAQIETGFPVLGRRLHPRIGRWVSALGRRFGLRRGRITHIPFSKVKDIGIDIEIDIDARRTRTTAWERWLRKTIVDRIPGSGS